VARSRECFSTRNTRQTLAGAATDAGAASVGLPWKTGCGEEASDAWVFARQTLMSASVGRALRRRRRRWQQQTLSHICRSSVRRVYWPREGKVLSVSRLLVRQTRALDASDASDARPGDASVAPARCRPLWTASVGPGGASVAQRRTRLSHGGEARQ
jgi:hypothetical protein